MLALLNGKIYVTNGFHEAIVIENSKIRFIGSDTDARSLLTDEDRVIDLKGRTVLPGFIDSHAHGGFSTGQVINRIDLTKCETVDEYLKVIKKFVSENPDIEFIEGMGWSSPLFEEAGPQKEMLDEICSDRPIVLKSGEGHALWANSRAIELAGITEQTPSPKGGVIEKNEDGSVRGTFKEEAQKLIEAVIPEISVEDFKEAILKYQKFMVSYGYTAATEMMVTRNSNLHKAYRELADEDKLLMKAEPAWLMNPGDDIEAFKDRTPVLKNKLIDGYYAKIFIDGVVENGTAWLKEPYNNNPGYCGEILWDNNSLFDTCTALDSMGYNIHFHVIGDAALKQMTDAMENVEERNGHSSRRTVAAHVQLADPVDIKRMKNLGISVSANPFWFFKDNLYYNGVELPLLGHRADLQYPMKSLMDEGIVVSSASDYSVTPEPDPLMGIILGVNRALPSDEGEAEPLNASEQADLYEMVDSFTINGAYTMNIEDITGSLEVGKLADMVVLDKDIFEIPLNDLAKAKVIMTISEGQIVYIE